MELNDLRPAPGSTRPRKRVGRGVGSGFGKTCGSGHKGQKSRSGGSVKAAFEGGQMPLQMRLPKFGFNSKLSRITAEIRTAELNKVEGDVVDLEALQKADVISGNYKRAKVMLSGEVTRALTVKGIGVTKGAREAIEKAGGKVEAVEAPVKRKRKAGKATQAKKATAAAKDAPEAPEGDAS